MGGWGFHYVEDVTYAFGEVHFTSTGDLYHKQFHTTAYQYQTWGECAVVDRVTHSPVPGGLTRKTERHLITPLVGDNSAEDERLRQHLAPPIKPLFMEAKLNCLMLSFVHAADTNNPTVLPALVAMGSNNARAPKIDIRYGPKSSMIVTFPSNELLKWVYDDAMKDRSA